MPARTRSIKDHWPFSERVGSLAPVPVVGLGGVDGTLAISLLCINSESLHGIAEKLAGTGTLVIHPLSFTAISSSGEPIPFVSVKWHYPVELTGASFTLEPGEVGLFELSVPTSSLERSFDLFYLPSDGPQVFLGTGGKGGCSGGGTAPVIIDME
jgi:hypothetical protein